MKTTFLRVVRITTFGALMAGAIMLSTSDQRGTIWVGALGGLIILLARSFVFRVELNQPAHRFSNFSGWASALSLTLSAASIAIFGGAFVSQFLTTVFWISFAVWLSPLPPPVNNFKPVAIDSGPNFKS